MFLSDPYIRFKLHGGGGGGGFNLVSACSIWRPKMEVGNFLAIKKRIPSVSPGGLMPCRLLGPYSRQFLIQNKEFFAYSLKSKRHFSLNHLFQSVI